MVGPQSGGGARVWPAESERSEWRSAWGVPPPASPVEPGGGEALPGGSHDAAGGGYSWLLNQHGTVSAVVHRIKVETIKTLSPRI